MPRCLLSKQYHNLILLCKGSLDHLFLTNDPYTHQVHQRIEIVRVVEKDFTAYHRHPKIIGIAAQGPHNCIDHIAYMFLFGISETQDIQLSHRFGTHGNQVTVHIPNSHGSLPGIYCNGMVV